MRGQELRAMNLSNRNPQSNESVGHRAIYRKIAEKKPLILPKKPAFLGFSAIIWGVGGRTVTSKGSGNWYETNDKRVISWVGAAVTRGSVARKTNGASTLMWTLSGSGTGEIA